jgi:uncharacterized protein (TIGR00303 family)
MEKITFNYLPEKGKNFLKKTVHKKTVFLCTIAHTETSEIPGISAAGANTELIKYTAAADVEAIYFGKAKCLPAIPENPFGPPSPVIISIAALKTLKIPYFPINAGLKVKPFTPIIEINNIYGKSLLSGEALEELDLNQLLEKTKILAEELSKSFEFVILGESVPGGTTTALALIEAFGYAAFNKICGSMPGNNHNLKINVVKKALKYISSNETPFDIVRKIADPMQPIQAFLTIELAKKGVKVLLAGGTQMVSVATLIKHINQDDNLYKNIAISTTKWVTFDNDSDIVGLMHNIKLQVPLITSMLNFSHSIYENLRLYEMGYVKEGVGAGALATVLFNETKHTNKSFLKEIEKVYQNIYGSSPNSN